MELEQAGKVRELKDQARKDAEAHALAQVEQFQVCDEPCIYFVMN